MEKWLVAAYGERVLACALSKVLDEVQLASEEFIGVIGKGFCLCTDDTLIDGGVGMSFTNNGMGGSKIDRLYRIRGGGVQGV